MHSTDPTTSTGSSNSPPGSGPREPRIYGDLQTLTSLELHALPAELWQAALHAELLALRVGQIPSVLSPNSRAHYMTKAKVGKQVRRHAQLVGLNALGKATTAGSFMWKRPMAEAIVTVVVCKCRVAEHATWTHKKGCPGWWQPGQQRTNTIREAFG